MRLVKTAPASSSHWRVRLLKSNVPMPEELVPTGLASIGRLVQRMAEANTTIAIILRGFAISLFRFVFERLESSFDM
jgi:hypothetical protein